MSDRFDDPPYQRQTATIGMRVKIVQLPAVDDTDAKLFDLSQFRIGEIRDVGTRMAEYLLASGYAVPYEG